MNNYEKKLDLCEIQSRTFDILKSFKSICKKHGLTYMLAYGTLLGAVRHKDFIPWDDDVDIMMPRPDFEKLETVYSEHNEEFGKNKLISVENNKEYFAPLAKIYDSDTILFQKYGQIEKPQIGLYIDIFIIDGLPENAAERTEFFKKAALYRKKWSLSARSVHQKSRNLGVYILKTIVSIPYRIIGYRYFAEKYERMASSYKYNESKYAGVVVYGEGEKKETFCREMFENRTDIEFHGEEFCAPADWNGYLTQIYGDYMQLPPVNERKPKHGSDIFIKPIC